MCQVFICRTMMGICSSEYGPVLQTKGGTNYRKRDAPSHGEGRLRTELQDPELENWWISSLMTELVLLPGWQ